MFVGAKVGIFFGLTKCLLLFHQHMHDDFCILGVVGNQKKAATSEEVGLCAGRKFQFGASAGLDDRFGEGDTDAWIVDLERLDHQRCMALVGEEELALQL